MSTIVVEIEESKMTLMDKAELGADLNKLDALDVAIVNGEDDLSPLGIADAEMRYIISMGVLVVRAQIEALQD